MRRREAAHALPSLGGSAGETTRRSGSKKRFADAFRF
ncbi:hypothetical protein BPC006_I1881 [Burkholderia pseudomallei BPC006]|nr:hypothetical protein BPC006_I1881 [Burkholderia pseudomallei BPC006]